MAPTLTPKMQTPAAVTISCNVSADFLVARGDAPGHAKARGCSFHRPSPGTSAMSGLRIDPDDIRLHQGAQETDRVHRELIALINALTAHLKANPGS